MCGSMVDIQSPTAEIRRGKKERRKSTKNIMSASATQGGHNKHGNIACIRCIGNKLTNSGYATWFTAGGAIRIAHYDVIDDVITRKL